MKVFEGTFADISTLFIPKKYKWFKIYAYTADELEADQVRLEITGSTIEK